MAGDSCFQMEWRGTGGRDTGIKGGGRCTGGGKGGAGSGITMLAEKERKRGKLRNIGQYFAIKKKMQRSGSQQVQGGNCDF